MNNGKITNESAEIDKIKYILNKWEIRTEKEFSNKYTYATEFDNTMAQSTAHRKFKHYGIVKNDKNIYEYVGKKLREPATEEDELCNLLNCYCGGIITKDDDKKELWISVDSESERIIAAKMTDYFSSRMLQLTSTNETKKIKDTLIAKRICILIGHSCLFIKVFSLDNDTKEIGDEEKRKYNETKIYEKIVKLIDENNKNL